MSRQYDAKQSALKAYPTDRKAGVDLFLEIVGVSADDFFHEEVMTPEFYIYGAPAKAEEKAASHTHGPWAFKVAANGDCGISAYDTGYFIECFADIRRSGENAHEEAKANARLVSAAPDLLEVAKALDVAPENIVGAHADCMIIRVPISAITSAAVAIAKAEGRANG